jgi:hypothetical protein
VGVVVSSAPWTTKFAVAAGVLTCWELALQRREGSASAGMRRFERVTAPLSRLIASGVRPTWKLCRCLAWITGAAALAAMGAYTSAPAGYEWLGELAGLLIGWYLLLAMIVLHNWRRPTTVSLVSAKEFLDVYVTEPVERRISTCISNMRYLAAFGFVVAAVLTI